MSTSNTLHVDTEGSAAATATDPVKEEKQTECMVCMSTYTNVIRQPVRCPYCPQEACRQCVSRYQLTTLNDPHCMGCKREWNKEFIDMKLTQVFRKGPLKAHRKALLVQRMKAKLPEVQQMMEAQKRYSQLSLQYHKCLDELNQIRRAIKNLTNTATAGDVIKDLEKKRDEMIKKRDTLGAETDALRDIVSGKKSVKQNFVMRCQADDCRGFLSTAWKCGVCDKYFCHECHAQKSGKNDDNHVCNAEAKETAKMIRQDTKACPKCGIRISKVDGCDQMWCTSCQTTFSWNTGEILLNTVVHNPHYYEYLRKVGNGVIPREAGDVPCGGLPNMYYMARNLERLNILTSDRELVYRIHRSMADLQDNRMRSYPTRHPPYENEGLCRDFLKGEIDEETFASTLLVRDTRFENRKDIGLILETLLHVGTEQLTGLYNNMNSPNVYAILKDTLEEMEHVRRYTNQCLFNFGEKMNIMIPYYNKDWLYCTIKTTFVTPEDIKESFMPDDYQRQTTVSSSEAASAPPLLPPPNAGAGGPPPIIYDGNTEDGYSTNSSMYENSDDETVYAQFGDETVALPKSALR